MKNKFKDYLPLFIIFSILLLLMASLSIFYNFFIFIIEITLAMLAVIFSLVSLHKFKSYTNTLLIKTAKDINFDNTSDINKLNLPAIILSKDANILWMNKKFTDEIDDDKELIGNKIFEVLSEEEFKNIKEKSVVNIKYNGKYFTCFGASFNDTFALYFYNDSKIKEKAYNYEKTRPVVMYISFDNYKELLDDVDDEVETQITAYVDRILKKWASTSNGVFKKLSNNSYFFVTQEEYLNDYKSFKFDIIDKIHQAKVDEKNYATLSIGVGYGAKTLKECEDWAKSALNMALGRGGDQVAIKKDKDYEFFGGLSLGTVKKDKVRTRVIASALINHINNSSNVFIMGHRFSDLDSVGASVGMYSAVKKGLNKEAYVVVDRKETLSSLLINNIESQSKDKIFISPKEAMEKIKNDTLLIIVDTHNPEFLESSEIYKKCKRTIVIDHHRMMVTRVKNALIFYHEPYASSASEMVTELIQYMGDYTINRIEAEALIAGIMLDTKNFILKTGERTFEAAAFLRSRGADTVEVKRMFSNSIDEYKTRFEIVSQAEIFNSCAVAYTDDTKEDIKQVAAQAADEILSIQGVNASFVLFPIENGIGISARSYGDINVQLIMEKLGGGGHQTMAGTQLYGVDITSAREKLIDIIRSAEKYMKEKDN